MPPNDEKSDALNPSKRDSVSDAPSASADTRYQPKPVPKWSYVGIRRRMRTMGGQLTLIGLSYVGAIGLAIAALFLRPILFDPYIRQRSPEANEKFVERVQKMADDTISTESIQDYTPEQVNTVYGILIDGRIDDSKKIVTRKLAEYQSPRVLVRLRVTAATGSEQQQQRAIDLLVLAGEQNPSEAVEICTYVRERARRTGRSALFQAADEAVKQLAATKGEG